jgi:UDP-glucose 6-dehydrogenase
LAKPDQCRSEEGPEAGVETRALVKIAEDHDVQLRIVESVLSVNDNRKRAMARKMSKRSAAICGENHRGQCTTVRRLDLIPIVMCEKEFRRTADRSRYR